MCHLHVVREFVFYRLKMGNYPNSTYVNLIFLCYCVITQINKTSLILTNYGRRQNFCSVNIKARQNKVLMFERFINKKF